MLLARAFIVTLATGLLTAPLAAEAQQAGRVWRIGLFHVGSIIFLLPWNLSARP